MLDATVNRGDRAVGVALVRGGQVIHEAAYGAENPVTGVTATAGSRFRLASVSKLLTTAVVLQLADEGKVRLDGTLAAQTGLTGPFGDPRFASITVRQLLSHTSGLPAGRNTFFGGGSSEWHYSAGLAAQSTLQTAPGTDFHYSNYNFCLLGFLIESVTGHRFSDEVTARVLAPLGIIDMRLAATVDALGGDVFYESKPERTYMQALGPAGGWIGTAADVALITAALSGAPGPTALISPADAALMQVPTPLVAPGDDWTYGTGAMLWPDGTWGHTGTVEDTHVLAQNRPDGLTVVVMVAGEVPWDTSRLRTIVDQALAG